MSNLNTLNFQPGIGSIVGTYINVEYGDNIQNINVFLGHSQSSDSSLIKGRLVTAAFWVVNNNFNSNTLIINGNSSDAIYCSNITSKTGNANFITINGQKYINTNTININTLEEIEFEFPNLSDEGIRSNKIFFALISTPDNGDPTIYDFKYNSLTIGAKNSGGYYYRTTGGINAGTKLQSVSGISLQFGDINVTHLNDQSNDSTIGYKPPKIQCSDLRYRTFSQGTDNLSQNGWNDGGETYESALALGKTIRNEKNNFVSDFDFPEETNRLKDVIFAEPEKGSYQGTNGIDEGRWVFKRSRIKFTIPPIRDSRGNIQKTAVIIRYRIEAAIYNKNAYRNEYVTKKYTLNESQKDITLIICPRDEGILDNTEFKVILDRCYVNGRNYSDPITYYFRTYQKPVVNIAYPKMVRNKSTGNDFKYAKILTSNMYSNFQGENAIVNKYVCDALNLLIASPKPDSSGIPLFVRFYIAEYKFGRNGCLSDDGTSLDESKFETGLSTFKSKNVNDYTSKDNILNGTASPMAYMTGINNCDGAPIVLSGRLTNKNIEDLITSETGQKLRLWTYRKWDFVVDKDNDIQVGNAYSYTTHEHDENGIEIRYSDEERTQPITDINSEAYNNGYTKDILLTDPITGDHCGMATVTSTYPDGDAKTISQNTSNVLLFRAGYVYLIRMRIFHGAAAGAIGKKYGNINPVLFGYGNKSIYKNSGKYDYENASVYGGEYPYITTNNGEVILDDISQYGSDKPYENPNTHINWVGPDDGTSGFSLNDERLNQTYPGFSEVDFTLIEPICPYTSKTNLITVHPTSPQIGVNQWLSFNYRHLSKNIGEIESYAKNPEGNLEQFSFGKTNGNILNVASRIMSMYTSCVEKILQAFTKVKSGQAPNEQQLRDPEFYGALWHDVPNAVSASIESEKLTLWIKPINERLTYNNEDEYFYTESQWRPINSETGKKLNIPLINKYECSKKTYHDMTNSVFYTHRYRIDNKDHLEWNDTTEDYIYYINDDMDTPQYGESGCFAYNIYRSTINGDNFYNYKETPYKYYKRDEYSGTEYHSYSNWPEMQIIYLAHNQTDPYGGTTTRRKGLIEPLGNTYRWQPVINAEQNNLQELQIEGQNTNNILQSNGVDYVGPNTLRNNNTYNADSIGLLYGAGNSEDDIQKQYFYIDNYVKNSLGYAFGIDTSNNETHRFTINEFAGTTTGNSSSSGWPAMYTTSATMAGPYSDHHKFNKYFSPAIAIPNGTGELFRRVPSTQDCENGDITAFTGAAYNDTNLPNTGGIISKLSETQPSIDSNFNNPYPLTRTTHYLYFKTWINTCFCMKVNLKLNVQVEVGTDLEGNPIYDWVSREGFLYFDGENMQKIEQFEGETELQVDDKAPIIYFGTPPISGNNTIPVGLSEVYGEDNRGWGRCLSADDACARKIKYNGDISQRSISGGIEVPILTRYTPLLQPQIAGESIGNESAVNITKISSNNKIMTITYYRNRQEDEGPCNPNLCIKVITSWTEVTPVVSFVDSGDGSSLSELQELTGYNLHIYYPYIAENNTYYTVSPNGGNPNNVYYENYYIDVDTDASKSIDAEMDKVTTETTAANNLDFLGGYGLCTAYTILLVPSDPDIEAAGITTAEEREKYFKNTDGHWNYYKQPANYYSTGDIFKIRSKSVPDAGPILVAHRLGPNTDPDYKKSLDYITPAYNSALPKAWKVDDKLKGRCFRTFKLDFKNLLDGQIVVRNTSGEEAISYTEFNANTTINTTNIQLTEHNKLKVGLTYDLVIIPIYDNTITNNYNYQGTVNHTGTINGNIYGGGEDDSKKVVTFYGSNPMVSFNYLQIANITEGEGQIIDDDGYRPSYDTDYDTDLESCSECNITDADHAIVFPNVDSYLFNMKDGIIKESPGFWLNNSFKLILRMPSFRTNATKLGENDLNTIEYLSNGQLTSENTANDFMFDDIQIHIGKISELKSYGYPYNMDNNLNKITSMEGLAKAHIISYKDYWDKGVFSKKLKGYGNDVSDYEDNRDIVTGGALTPNDTNYKNRFIEVNLSNARIMDNKGDLVPIYSLYSEGYYIQFRWKSAYAAGNDSSQWSDWHGGSINGGEKWWGDKGLSYYVPVKNYSDVHTDFRNYIKESYPGSLISTVDNHKSDVIGKGSYAPYGDINDASQTNPKNANSPGYYHNGSVNHKDTVIVPDINDITITINEGDTQIDRPYNDNPYYDEIAYKVSHDINFTIPKNISNLHQQLWEMLYIDYIIRNMCKLYYKPNHNDVFTKTLTGKTYTTCNLAVPRRNNTPIVLDFKTVGWDESEVQFNYDEEKNNSSSINNDRTTGPKINEFDTIITDKNPIKSNIRRWNRNKYYRKVITKQDFDELNEHLQKLTDFTRDSLLAGVFVNDPILGNVDVLLKDKSSLTFNKSRKLLIGNTFDSTPGLTKINNINHTMMSSNYIQNIWQNILSVISTGSNISYDSTKIQKNITY